MSVAQATVIQKVNHPPVNPKYGFPLEIAMMKVVAKIPECKVEG